MRFIKNFSVADPDRLWRYLAGLAIVAGAAVRFYAAWTLQFFPMRDSAVVMLMAKHMAERLDFPVFYYGQPYMGSLEPAVSAVVCAIFGISAFAVCTGTVLLGILVTLIVYWLARDAAGPRAGFFAVVYLIASSDAMLYLSAHPRGGYMTLLVFGLLVVLCVNRFADPTVRPAVAARWLVLAGFFAGLGWWNNQLVIVFLAAATLVALPCIKKSLYGGALFLAVAAFMLGSLPWWWWNIGNAWATFSFSSSFGEVGFSEGFGRLSTTLPEVLGYKPWPSLLSVAQLLGLALLMAVALAWGVRRAMQKGWRSLPVLTVGSSFVVILAMALLYTYSHFCRQHTPRYLLPIVPAAAVLVGVGLQALWPRRRLVIPALALLVLVIPHTLYRLPLWNDRLESDRGQWSRAGKLADFLQEHCDGVVAGDFLFCWATFASLERAIVVNMPEDSYAPYSRRAALVERQAFLNNLRGIRNFIQATGASGREDTVAGFRVDHAIRPSSGGWDYLPVDDIVSVRDCIGDRDVAGLLTDGNLDTVFASRLDVQTNAVIEWTFAGPTAVNGMLVMNSQAAGLGRVRIEGRRPAGDWVVLLADTVMTGYFWSGPRIYYQGLDYLQECRFQPLTGGITGLRLTASATKAETLVLPEIVLLESTDSAAAPLGLDAAVRWIEPLRQRAPGRLYAPRWIAERVWGALADRMDVRVSSYMSRSVNQLPRRDSMAASCLDLDRRTALIVDGRDAARTRALLKGQRLVWEESGGEGWVLFMVEPVNVDERLESVVPLYWTDRGLFASDGQFERKERSAGLYRRAMACGDPVLKTRLLEKALLLAPEHRAASRAYVAALRGANRHEAATVEEARWQRNQEPLIEADGTFEDGIALAGVSIEPRRVRAGEDVMVTLFWRCKPGAGVERWAVFCHYRLNGTIVFQDDHNLCDGVSRAAVEGQRFEQLFAVSRVVRVPDSVQGDIELGVGLYSPVTQKKSPVSSRHETRKRTVVIPSALQVSGVPGER